MDELNEEKQIQREFVKRLFTDRFFAVENLITVTNKSGKKIKLTPWEGQKRFLKWKRFCVNEAGQFTLIVVKLRQGGITTLSIGDSLLDAVYLRGQDHLYLCKNGEDKEPLFDRLKLMEEELPYELRLQKQRDTSTAIKFELPHGSSVRILEAGNSLRVTQKKGRSATSQYLHITEAAYIEHLGALMTGAKGSVSPDGCICLESTPNGAQGYFYALAAEVLSEGHVVEQNVWRKGNSVLVFLPYWEHCEYQSKNPLLGDLNEKELRLRAVGAPDSAIQWRREQIAETARDEIGMTPEERFDREYPSEVMDGFRATGKGFFRSNVIDAMTTLNRGVKPFVIGLDEGGNMSPPHGANTFEIFAPPVSGWENRYSCFMDVAEGLPTSDYDCAYVFDRVAKMVVAKHYGRFGTFNQVPNVLNLCRYYGNAWLSFDRTGCGVDRVPLLLRDYEGVNLLSKRDKDGNLEMPNPTNIGVSWTWDSRRTATSVLKGNIESMDWSVKDATFWSEADKFVFPDDGGSPCAANGFHDDAVMTMAGLCWMEDKLPHPKQIKTQSNKDLSPMSLSKLKSKAENKPIGNF